MFVRRHQRAAKRGNLKAEEAEFNAKLRRVLKGTCAAEFPGFFTNLRLRWSQEGIYFSYSKKL